MKALQFENLHLPICMCLAFSAACSSGDDVGSVHIIDQQVIALRGADLEITADDYAPLAKTRLIIPSRSLAADQRITIGVGDDISIEDVVAVGPAADFGPDGTTFQSDVVATLPIDTDVDPMLLRVFVTQADGSVTAMAPAELNYDSVNRTVSFFVEHFTTFQCGRVNNRCDYVSCPGGSTCRDGVCDRSCTADECGPQPLASWECDDGSIGGSTGVCERTAAGECAWVINWCEPRCTDAECGPRPEIADRLCANGDTAGAVCRRGREDRCGWDIVDCCENDRCGANQICDPGTGECKGRGEECGMNFCRDDQVCCNASCGYCVAPNESCTEEACNDCRNGIPCAAGTACDPTSGECVRTGQECGPVQCGRNEVCCNDSCGICVPPGGGCHDGICDACTTVSCPPGHVCETSARGNPVCVPIQCAEADCGPRPLLPNYECRDGTQGGPTDRCLPTGSGDCAWEIIHCEAACTPSDCGPPPTNDSTMPCSDGTVSGFKCDGAAGAPCTWSRNCP